MEVVEPLLITLTGVRELLSRNEDVRNEVEDLGTCFHSSTNKRLLISVVDDLIYARSAETINLIDVAISPLKVTNVSSPHLNELLQALQQWYSRAWTICPWQPRNSSSLQSNSLNKAKEALEAVLSAKKGFHFFSWFRPRNNLKELKAHQEKLKTLCPILSLAISTSQSQQNHQRQQQPPMKRRKIEGAENDSTGSSSSPTKSSSSSDEDERTRKTSTGYNQGFDAGRLLKNDETRHFWLLHFGAKVFPTSSKS